MPYRKYYRRNYGSKFVSAGVGAAAGMLATMLRRKAKIGSKTKTVPKTRMRKRTKRRTAIGTSVTLTRRRKTFRENHSTENHTRSLQVRARLPSALKMINAMMEPQWFRVQGLTQYDQTTGFYPIANRLDASNQHILPMHIWDITSQPNVSGASVPVNPVVGYGCYFNTVAAAAPANVYPLQGQDQTGVTNAQNIWIDENTSSATLLTAPLRKCMHHYTHIKLNLYGVRARSTRYLVQLVMVSREYGDFISAAANNVEKRKVFDYLMRPFIYSNLNSGDPQTKRDIKILKTYETWVAPITTDEYNGSEATPHIQTLNWFIRHERVRVYDWHQGDQQNSDQNAGFDVDEGEVTGRVEPEKRVYLLIRALCPTRRSVADTNVAPDPITEPSYDLVIRNKFSHPL